LLRSSDYIETKESKDSFRHNLCEDDNMGETSRNHCFPSNSPVAAKLYGILTAEVIRGQSFGVLTKNKHRVVSAKAEGI
jgi:hypothetical protein